MTSNEISLMILDFRLWFSIQFSIHPLAPCPLSWKPPGMPVFGRCYVILENYLALVWISGLVPWITILSFIVGYDGNHSGKPEEVLEFEK